MPVKKTVKKTKFFEKDKTLRWIIFDNRLKKLKEKKTILLYLFNCNHKTTAFAQKQIFVLQQDWTGKFLGSFHLSSFIHLSSY